MKNNVPELYLLILWNASLYKKDEIINHLENNFDILQVSIIEWSKKTFFENLFIFYDGSLPLYSEKDKYSGNKSFYSFVVRDNNPNYKYIITELKNKYLININIYNSKNLYRKLTNGGHKIHCSDNKCETTQQLKLLFNKPYKYYLEKEINKTIIHIKQELIFNQR